MSMNKKLVLFFLGTKVQDFMASTLSFCFLLIFYNLSGSVFDSGAFTAISIVVSRIVMFFLIPILKQHSPAKVSSAVSVVMGIAALLATLLCSYLSRQIYFYVCCLVIFTTIQEISRSFTNSILPRIVDKSYLFKANSLNGIFFNLSLILAPICSYFFNATNIRMLFPIYLSIAIFSSIVMYSLYRLDSPNDTHAQAMLVNKRTIRFYTDEWAKTTRLIVSSPNILFCILIGVSINVIFAGINGPFLLKMGGNNLGSTLIKISLAVGSMLGVYGAFVLKVKERYHQYLHISVWGIVCTLLILILVNQHIVLLIGMIFLTTFVMFIMNSTGTLLQLVTPLHEIPAVYELRSTLYSIVVPLSYVCIGWLLDHTSYRVYFALSIVLLMLTWYNKKRIPVELQTNAELPS